MHEANYALPVQRVSAREDVEFIREDRRVAEGAGLGWVDRSVVFTSALLHFLQLLYMVALIFNCCLQLSKRLDFLCHASGQQTLDLPHLCLCWEHREQVLNLKAAIV